MSTTAKARKAPATEPAAAVRYDCFAVRTYTQDGQEKHEWIKCGVAFPHKDGQGFRIVLAAVPVDGQIVARIHEPTAAE